MNPIPVRRANVAIALSILALMVYVAMLLASNYRSQTRLVAELRKSVLDAIEKQALGIGYFHSDRRQDLRELANSKEVATYFENQALGMSYQNGLTTSLMEMKQHFQKLVDAGVIGSGKIYDWIFFIRPDGTPMTGSGSYADREQPASFQLISDMATDRMDVRYEKKNDRMHAIFTLPYWFKNRLCGYLAADVPLDPILTHLVDRRDMGTSSQAHLFCTQSGVLVPEDDRIPAEWLAAQIAGQEQKSGVLVPERPTRWRNRLALAFARVDGTDLYLMHTFPEEDLLAGLKPRDTLLAMLLLSMLIVGGLGLFIHSTIQKRLLAGRMEASLHNAKVFRRQNENLSREIAGREQIEQALEKANKELKQTSAALNYILTSATEFAIAAVDPQYRIIHFNPAAERILKAKGDDVMNKRLTEIHHLRKVSPDRFEAGIATARREGKYEYTILTLDASGETQRLHAVIMPMHDDSRAIIGYIFFAIDITRQHESEKRLRLSEEKYRALIENMPDIVFSIDPRLIVREVSLPKSQSYGLKADAMIDRPFGRFIHMDDNHHVLESIRIDLRSRKKIRRGLRFRMVTGDGRPRWMDLNLHYQYENDGTCLKANGVLRDITERKELEGQLLRTERLAAAGQLAASIAHEINSPLAGISALLALVRKRHVQDGETVEYIDLVRKAFESIGGTVQNLLDLCRPDLEGSQPADVNAIIQNTVALSRAYLKKKGITVNLDLSPSVPVFNGYPRELGQVVLNFINNSIEAMETGPTSDRKEILIKTTVSDRILVEYTDSGPGIAEQDLNRIFDPFFTSKKTVGMGVGLSICHDIVARNHGTIKALAARTGAHFVVAFDLPRPDVAVKAAPMTESTDHTEAI